MNTNKIKQLNENWSAYNFGCMEDDKVTFAHYVCVQANNEPGFFRWLFDNGELSDFECENESDFSEFVASIVVDEDKGDEDVREFLKRIVFNENTMHIYAYGYGCYNSPFHGDAEVEMDMQEYLDNEVSGNYEVAEKAFYFEDEDCWSAKVVESDEQ